jgi:hypothetical protein
MTTPAPAAWPQVGELATTLGARALPPSSALGGQTLPLRFVEGGAVDVTFAPAGDQLTWTEAPGQAWAAPCRVTQPAEGLYLVDLIDPRRPAAALTLVADLTAGAATVLTMAMPDATELSTPLFQRAQRGLDLSPVASTRRRARIGGPAADGPVDWHAPTDRLVGRRISYRYSETDVYEHIYLSTSLYTWRCLAGTELGLADTDQTEHLAIREDLVLFIWREKIIPTLGLVLIDLAAGRSSGKVFGYTDTNLSRLTNAPIAASIIRIADAGHPPPLS